MSSVAIGWDDAVHRLTLWFASLGLPGRVADVVVTHVMSAESVGRTSHGLRLLPALAREVGRSSSLPDDVTVTEREAGTLTIEASGLPGIYSLHRATEELAACHRRGRRSASIGVVGFSGTTGCLGLYAHNLAEAGLTGLVLVTSPSIMASPGSSQPLLGTNAVSFGAPTLDGQPLVGDFASSESPYGAIALARDRNETVPLGVLLDKDGQPTTDPSAIFDGTLLPSGGHRGWCQALLVEVLAGALVGGKVGRGPGGESALILSFMPDTFGADDTAGAVGELTAQIRSSDAIPDRPPPHVPGERFAMLHNTRTTLSVEAKTIRRIEEMGGPSLG